MVDYICSKCLYVGAPKKKKQGSGKIEAIGWALFPFGLPYTLWRMFSKLKTCRHCDAPSPLRVTSKEGAKLVAMIESELASIPVKPKPLPPILAAKEPTHPASEKPKPSEW